MAENGRGGLITIAEYAVIFCILIALCDGSPLPSQNCVIEEKVANFIEDVDQSRRPCTIVIGHDYPLLPPSFTKLLDRLAHSGQLAIPLSLPKHMSYSNASSTGFEYWFSWLHRLSAVRQGKCYLIAILTTANNFQPLVEYVARQVQISTTADRFIIWSRDGHTEQILSHPHARVFMWKVGISVVDTSLKLQTVCFFCDNGEPQLMSLGEYQGSSQLQIFPDTTVDLHGKDLKGIFLYTINIHQVRYMIEHFMPAYHMDTTLVILGDRLNFSWAVEQMQLDESGMSEMPRPDGTWTGMTGGVLSGNYDFASCIPWSYMANRVIDYPRGFTYNYYTFVTRQPLPIYWQATIQSYTPLMWLLILTAAALATLIFWLILHIQDSFWNPFHPHRQPKSNLLYSARFLFFTIVEESPSLIPTSPTTRVFLAFWWMYSMVITVGYDSKLISFMAAPPMEIIPENFKELTSFPDWEWGAAAMHAHIFRMMVGRPDIPYLDVLLSKLKEVDTLPDCMDRSLHGKFACLSLELHLRFQSPSLSDKEGNYPLLFSKENSVAIVGGNLLPKHSILLPVFDRMIQRLWDGGIWAKLMDDFKYNNMLQGLRNGRALGRLYARSMALHLEQMKGPLAFWMLFTYGLGIVFFCGEVIYAKKVRKVHAGPAVNPSGK